MTFNEALRGTKNKVIDLNKPIYCSSEICIGEEDLKIDKKKDGTYDVNLIILGKISRNGAVYDPSGFVKSVEHNRIITERIAQNKWWGEENHPPPRSAEGRVKSNMERAERIKQIDSKNVQHRINRWWTEGNVFRGNVEPAPPLGKVWSERVEMGMNPAFSVRSLTPEFEHKVIDGKKCILKKFYIDVVTFDGVDLGGFYEATASNPYEFGNKNPNKNVNAKLSQEDFNESFEYKEEYDNIIRMVKEDEGLEALSDLFNFDLSKYGKITILGEEGLASIVSPTGIELNVHIQTLALNTALNSI